MNANPSAADVRQAVERAFTPDLSLIWRPTLRAWAPNSTADHIILRQLNHGATLVRNIDQFRADHPDLCIETISP